MPGARICESPAAHDSEADLCPSCDCARRGGNFLQWTGNSANNCWLLGMMRNSADSSCFGRTESAYSRITSGWAGGPPREAPLWPTNKVRVPHLSLISNIGWVTTNPEQPSSRNYAAPHMSAWFGPPSEAVLPTLVERPAIRTELIDCR